MKKWAVKIAIRTVSTTLVAGTIAEIVKIVIADIANSGITAVITETAIEVD